MITTYDPEDVLLPLTDDFNYMPSGTEVHIDGGTEYVKEGFSWIETGPEGLERHADPREIHSDLYWYGGRISTPELRLIL